MLYNVHTCMHVSASLKLTVQVMDIRMYMLKFKGYMTPWLYAIDSQFRRIKYVHTF